MCMYWVAQKQGHNLRAKKIKLEYLKPQRPLFSKFRGLDGLYLTISSVSTILIPHPEPEGWGIAPALQGPGPHRPGAGGAGPGQGLGGAGRAGDLNVLSAESSARAEVVTHQISPSGPETSGPQFRLERWWKDQVVL